MTSYDAVVLAGGTGRRLGGVDKPALVVHGRALLDRVLDAVAGAASTVVVGPERPVSRPVRWTREQPAGAGPAAALGAGLAIVTAPLVVLVAADLPFLDGETVAALLSAVGGTGAVAVDADGREQWLLSAWRADVLGGALVPKGALRDSLRPLQPVSVAVTKWASVDVDTAADLRRAEEQHEHA